MRIAILGGGITGCVFAAELADDPRFHIDLFERSDRLGGLHNSPVIDGLAYDIGAFVFHSDDQMFKTFHGLVDLFVDFSISVMTVTDNGRLDKYPLTIKGYVRDHGIAGFVRASADLLFSKLRHRRRDSLPAFIKYYIGGTVYEQSGLRSYIERLYSLPADEVHLMFAEQRLGNLAQRASLRRIVGRFLVDPRSQWNQGYFAPGALARPEAGFAAAYDYIESALLARRVSVYKGANVSAVTRDGHGFWLQLPGGAQFYDQVVSTIPLPVTAKLLSIPLEHQFDTISLLTLFYRFQGDAGFDADVLSNFTHSGEWKRIVDFSHHYRGMGGHWLSVEIPAASDVKVPLACQQFENHVRSLGLFNGELRFQDHVLTRNAYPVYRTDGIEKLPQDKERILASGVILAGRQGQFEYVSSDQAARHAAQLAQQMKAGVLGGPD